MNTTNKILIGITVLLIVILGVLIVLNNRKNTHTAQVMPNKNVIEQPAESISPEPDTVRVRIEDYQIVPQSVSFNHGKKVIFINNGSGPITIENAGGQSLSGKTLQKKEEYEMEPLPVAEYTYTVKSLIPLTGRLIVK